MLDEIIWVTGALCVAYVHYLIFWALYARVLTQPTDWSKYQGEWAVVTGASYGIGLSIAEKLAEKKINVIVIARSKGKNQEENDPIIIR
jgi:hypothetical protein